MRKYRIHNWYNEEADTGAYGIQTHDKENKRWLHCCRNEDPLIFDTEEQAQKEMEELKFKEWEKEVRRLLIEQSGWTQRAVDSIDWNTFKKDYFFEGVKPEEAILQESSYAF